MSAHLLHEDLDAVLALTEGVWDDLRGARLFLTGGTGFFGCWLLETALWANDRLGLGLKIVALTRDPVSFARKAPPLAAHPAVTLWAGDVREFSFPEGAFTHVLHAATDSDTAKIVAEPLQTLETIVQGTRRVLDFAVAAGAQRVLLTSSGAVYGRQPPELTHVDEDYSGAPDVRGAAASYGEGKRVSEMLGAMYARQHGLEVVLTRPFAFVGPYLPLTGHYAVGNFLGNGLRGEPLKIGGDGTPRRSYLYASDLAVWLWTLLVRGQSLRPYNIGSEDAVTIEEMARQVAACFGGLPVEIARAPVPGRASEQYVPSTVRARAELGLRQTVSLGEALRKTIRWHQQLEKKL